MRNRLLIIGASGHGKVIADIAKKNGYTDICFLDDNERLSECGSYPVIGKSKDAANYPNADVIVAIGNPGDRERIQNHTKNIISLVHPDAVIGEDVSIGEGTVIMAGTVINSGTVIGKGCIINTCSSIDHDCIIGDYVHVSVGVHIAGTGIIGKGTWVGIGASVSNNLSICGSCMIGAGTLVVKDITEPGTYVGIPAKRIK